MITLMKLILTLIALILTLPAHASTWNGKIIYAQTGQVIGLPEMAMNLVFARNVILGEKHNTPSVQLAQAKVMEAVISLAPDDQFSTAWEFLNYKTQAQTESAFQKFVNGRITVEEFLIQTQGSSKYTSYAPILEMTKKYGGRLIGANLSREDKEPVTQGGIENAKPGTVPVGFEMGGKNYFERFVISMQGHASDEQIQNYFASQCLTDDVVAVQMLADTMAARRFLVVGSFHSDYFDGAVARLMKRAPNQVVGVVRFVDASDYTDAELQSLAIHQKYGPIADFVYFVNEPKTAN